MPQVLLLECVKELNDAYDLMQLLDLHGLKLQQVGCYQASLEAELLSGKAEGC